MFKPCVVCGADFRVDPSRADRRLYCSRECYRGHFNTARLSGPTNGRWRGGRALSYGPDWKFIKLFVRARDQVCRHCGMTPEQNGRALDVHHVIPYRFSGDSSLTNLEALCRTCHMRADDHGRAGSAQFLHEPKQERPTKRELRRQEQKERACARHQKRKQDQEMARRLHSGGKSLRHIARALGVSHQTVANWLGVPYRTGEATIPYLAG